MGRLIGRLRSLLVIALLLVSVAIVLRRFGPGFVGGVALGIVLGIVGVFGGMMVFARRVSGRMAETLRPAVPRPTSSWDYAMELRTLDDQPVDASSFRERVLFLNFWATWCAPCVAEMPSIEGLAARLADTDVAIACVTREPAEKVRAFIAKKGLRLPIYLMSGEPPPVFESLSIPATFVVAPGGAVSFRHIGAARWDSDQMVAFLRNGASGS